MGFRVYSPPSPDKGPRCRVLRLRSYIRFRVYGLAFFPVLEDRRVYTGDTFSSTATALLHRATFPSAENTAPAQERSFPVLENTALLHRRDHQQVPQHLQHLAVLDALLLT